MVWHGLVCVCRMQWCPTPDTTSAVIADESSLFLVCLLLKLAVAACRGGGEGGARLPRSSNTLPALHYITLRKFSLVPFCFCLAWPPHPAWHAKGETQRKKRTSVPFIRFTFAYNVLGTWRAACFREKRRGGKMMVAFSSLNP